MSVKILALPGLVTLTLLSASAQTEKEVVAHYATLVHATYADALEKAKTMEKAIEDFLASPSASSLEKARSSWTAARLPYLQTEVFRFYEGPIDDEDGPEGLLNAWPLDESYVDYVKGDEQAGIINKPDDFPKIDADLIQSLNEKGGEANISCGYHAIEFLLWGQDFSAGGPGERPFTDYTTADNAKRRATYLRASTKLLIKHLAGVSGEWEPDKENYRASFLKLEPRAAIEKILTGMSMLSGFEMASERLNVAYDTKAQEDEHSCFSDTTHNDMVYDLVGISNVWNGTYQTVKGPGLKAVAEKADPALAKHLDARITASVAAARAIPVPFDQAILGEDSAPNRRAILRTIESLEEQAGLMVTLSKKLGFEVPISED